MQVKMKKFSHLDETGAATMVDVGAKPPQVRRAIASGELRCEPATIRLLQKQALPKGDVLACARVAGIMAAKRTSDMIPLCHPLQIGAVRIDFEVGDTFVAIEAQVDTVDRTGVEMEALHACSVAALTIYDMCKSADKAMSIEGLTLWEKTGGKSGPYKRADGQ